MSEHPALYEEPVAAAVFLALLAVAALQDVVQRRIGNRAVMAVAVGGAVWQLYAGGWQAAALAVGCGLLVIAVLWLPWRKGGIGGGDVKLGAAAAIWVGAPALLTFVVVSAAAGGLVASIVYVAAPRAVRGEIRGNLWWSVIQRTLPDPQRRARALTVPYAVAIVAGASYVVLAPWLHWPT